MGHECGTLEEVRNVWCADTPLELLPGYTDFKTKQIEVIFQGTLERNFNRAHWNDAGKKYEATGKTRRGKSRERRRLLRTLTAEEQRAYFYSTSDRRRRLKNL